MCVLKVIKIKKGNNGFIKYELINYIIYACNKKNKESNKTKRS